MLRKIALLCLLLSWTAAASDEVLERGCMICHGSAQAPTLMPAFFHRSPAFIAQRLREFRDGTREGSVMPHVAGGLDDAEIERLAAHFGRQE